MSAVRNRVLDYLQRTAPSALGFWTEGRRADGIDIMTACDVLYALVLIGCAGVLSASAGGDFAGLLSRYTLVAQIGHGAGPPLGVHLSAYVLGVLNLLKSNGRSGHRQSVRTSGWKPEDIIDVRTLRPSWPWYLSHHSWRVGHWIGGAPSILHSLWKLCPDLALRNGLPHTEAVLRRSDDLIDAESGTLRAYRCAMLQSFFRQVYRLRHNPVAGDIGGIAHLHWVNYAAGRLPYKGAPALFDRTWALLQRRPFIERVPYCLDFDVLQVARTALPDGDVRRDELQERARIYADDLVLFYARALEGGYVLHRLPGGLATLHESALTAELSTVPDLSIPPIDIVKEACWI